MLVLRFLWAFGLGMAWMFIDLGAQALTAVKNAAIWLDAAIRKHL